MCLLWARFEEDDDEEAVDKEESFDDDVREVVCDSKYTKKFCLL